MEFCLHFPAHRHGMMLKHRDFIVFRRFRKIAEKEYSLHHDCLSVRMQQLGSHWTDFYKI